MTQGTGDGTAAGNGRPPHELGTEDPARLAREAAFHDHALRTATRAAAGRFYDLAARSKKAYRHRVLRGCEGLDVLEYGCGPGSCAFELARHGARVTGIDISPGAIQQARQLAVAQGLEGRLRFEVMNAEALRLPAASCDRLCGSGILHHLDLERALAEIGRVLRPRGDAVFFEPLGHNPLINWYRRRTPSMRTEDEHPLRVEDLRRLQRAFRGCRFSYHHLAVLAAAPCRDLPGFGLVQAVLTAVDGLLLRLPVLRRQAWIVIAELEGPRAGPGAPVQR